MDGVSAEFCAQCGLPQLRVSGEFSVAERAASLSARSGDGRSSAGLLDWPLALRIAGVAAMLGLLPCAMLPGALLYGMAGVFALVVLPLCALAGAWVYQRRRPQREFTVGMGARMGAALAVLLAGMVLLGTGVTGFAVRYAGHSRALEEALDTAFVQAMVRAQEGGSAAAPGWAAVLGWPEVRSGFFVGMEFVQALLLVLVGGLSGALAGALLHARWRRAQREE